MSQQRSSIIYNNPLIPSIKSTTRYNHALALARTARSSVLITNVRPPMKIKRKYDNVHILGEVNNGVDMLKRAYEARNIVHKACNQSEGDRVVYVTSFHYAQALSGYLSNVQWAVDIYDDPIQLSIRRSAFSPHQIALRLLLRILDNADIGIATLHPDGPRSNLGRSTRFALNGSPVSSIYPGTKPSKSPLQCVWVGKTEVGWGIELLLKSLADIQEELIIDVYGTPDSSAKSLATELGVREKIQFHGNVSHEQVRTAIEDAHVGLCVLTPYADFKYSFPIKVGEYLAGGTIPLSSNFPGIRMVAGNAGIYIKPDSLDLTTALEKLATMDNNEMSSLADSARKRAETISWKSERERFAEHVIRPP